MREAMVAKRKIIPRAARRRIPRPVEVADPVAAARAAGLRYVSDARPGICRRRAGKGFRYFAPDGTPITDRAELARIRALAIPPAWRDVWICPNPRGHIQATGRDDKGRKQYRYHPLWRALRDQTKYHRMIAFGEALPTIRRRVAEDLQRPCLCRQNVLAMLVRLLDTTSLRVGNEEYARQNEHYGLTTLRNEHVLIAGARLRIECLGKSGKWQAVEVRDRQLARLVRRCQELPGDELFQYVGEDSERHAIGSEDVNDYLREISGQDFTAKDFRTWAGTVAAAAELARLGPASSATQAKQHVTAAIKVAAQRLGNTPAICKSSYVHPSVIQAYLDGGMVTPEPPAPRAMAIPAADAAGLSEEETTVLALLRRMEAESETQLAGA